MGKETPHHPQHKLIQTTSGPVKTVLILTNQSRWWAKWYGVYEYPIRPPIIVRLFNTLAWAQPAKTAVWMNAEYFYDVYPKRRLINWCGTSVKVFTLMVPVAHGTVYSDPLQGPEREHTKESS